ncbi:MAG: tryptophan synthase subunit alpha [Thermodesulfobacteriota bacterium]
MKKNSAKKGKVTGGAKGRCGCGGVEEKCWGRGAKRIERVFSELGKAEEKAFIPFVTAGDPSLDITEKLIFKMEAAGADIIELGIPFSDPMADGPTIQASSERALLQGVTIKKVLELVKKVRTKSGIPIILFGYYNPIFAYGLGKFARDAKKAGADGLLVVDLPPEESCELEVELRGEGLALVFLLTPVSDEKRMRLVAKKGSGFIYFVSLTGVTGARVKMKSKVAGHIKELRRFTKLPIGVGFGVSSPGQAKELGAHADGVIVGSAIIDIIAKTSPKRKAVTEVGKFVASLKDALRP